MSSQQLGLFDAPPPRAWRSAVLEHYHAQGQPVTVDEALFREQKAKRQGRSILALFAGRDRLTPSEAHDLLVHQLGSRAPLLTSVRRSLTDLTKAGLLVHHKADRRPGPHGSKESTWGLSE